MKTYQVGGAVRDRLLGLPVHDIDYVVVGSSVKEMLGNGFRPVGSHFPVFLHPQTQHEYALARTERKTAPGHQGFVFHADPSIRLADDLKRRDLTINAMAQEVNASGELVGHLIDPYRGKVDLEQGIFRHLSDAFSEDPLRVLRVARFAARFPTFTIAPETLAIMKYMVSKDELKTLSKERIWQELARALRSQAPERFIDVLEECGALEEIWPTAFTVQWRNMSSRKEMLAQLNQVVAVHPEIDKRLAILLKKLKPVEISTWGGELRVPNEITEYCFAVAEFEACHEFVLSPHIVLDLFNRTDVWRKPARFTEVMKLFESIGVGVANWSKLVNAALQVDGGQIAAKISQLGSSSNLGEQIHQAVVHARLMAISQALD
ncbi:MAG: polynucleotide adenylyltransferase [Limnohabitans sp.]|nr:polynucleotide adenylyltransferase [Limnohabitans sp.]